MRLQVLNPEGEIDPGFSAAVQWKFSPIEAKTYMVRAKHQLIITSPVLAFQKEQTSVEDRFQVDVPIAVEGGDTALVTFTGVGYDERALGDTMQPKSQMNPGDVPSEQRTATFDFTSSEAVDSSGWV